MAKGIDKELKKIQKRGIYNPKVRVFSIIAIAVLTLGIGLTFSAFSYSSGDSQAFNSTVTKKVNITVKTTNGIINKDNGHILAGTLAAKILENNTAKTNPNFSASHADNGLYVQKGDNTKSIDGTPTYYFRGEVTNNYVSFAGKTWRIIRINEDGTVRLLGTTNIGSSTYGSNTRFSGSTAETKLKEYYNNNLKSYDNYIATTSYCNDITGSGWGRLHTANPTPTFVCPSSLLNLKIGLITGDEMAFTGHITDENAKTWFKLSTWSWTMTTALGSDPSTSLLMAGLGYQISNTNNADLYPVINLRAEALYKSGNGTESSPYVVEGISTTTDTYTKESRYGKSTDIYVNSYDDYVYDSVTCTNGQSATYDSNSKKLTISAKKDTTCTVNFKVVHKLSAAILANNTLKTTTPDFSTTTTGLYKAEDDKGTSYYFRGSIENNYVDIGTTYSEDVGIFVVGMNAAKGIPYAESTQAAAESRCNTYYSTTYGYATAAACIADIQDQSAHSGNKMLWRVVRINGDGSVRLISDNIVSRKAFNSTSSNQKYAGYTYDNSAANVQDGTPSTIKTYLDSWYTTNISNKGLDSLIETSTYCNDTSISSTSGSTKYYGANTRISNNTPQLTCNDTLQTYGGKYSLKVGLLSADELMMAGYKSYSQKPYIWHSNWFWTGSVHYSSSTTYIFFGANNRNIGSYLASNIGGVRPVINLKSDVTISSGDGSASNPYIVE